MTPWMWQAEMSLSSRSECLQEAREPAVSLGDRVAKRSLHKVRSRGGLGTQSPVQEQSVPLQAHAANPKETAESLPPVMSLQRPLLRKLYISLAVES